MNSIAGTYVSGDYDIDRVHRAVNNYVGRCGGNTFATLMLMLGEVQLGDPGNNYLYVGENKVWTRDVSNSFTEMVRFEGFQTMYSSNTNTLTIVRGFNDDVMVRFVPVGETLSTAVRGYEFSRVFVDVTPEKHDVYRNEIALAISRER